MYYKSFAGGNFRLLYDEVLSWDGKDESTGKIISPYPADIAAVLNSVITVFGPHYGSESMDKLKTCIVPCGDNPSTVKDMGIIGLTARGQKWNAYAYEFSHELCHLTIPGEVSPPLRWFEESICELASIFFLPKITSLWEIDPPHEHWKSYAQWFEKYANNVTKKDVAQIPEGQPFSEFFSDKIESLSANCYQRDINRLCAIKMHPIFTEYPQLWKEVPLLIKLGAEPSFKVALTHWKELADARQGIEKIVELFTID